MLPKRLSEHVMLKKIPVLLLLCSFKLFAAVTPQANDDHASLFIGLDSNVQVDLTKNDRNGFSVTLNSSLAGKYGYLKLSGTTATYTPYKNKTNAALTVDQVVTDTFNYSYLDSIGQSSTAKLIIEVFGNPEAPTANDDYASVVVGINPTVSVDLVANDFNGSSISVNGGLGQYGFLQQDFSSHSCVDFCSVYTYTLYDNSENYALDAGKIGTDTFTYSYINKLGQSSTGKLTVEVKSILESPKTTLSNVDIEFNNLSKNATPLNSGKIIKGHLHSIDDIDWYSLHSLGNEIISVDVCPQGSSCFGKKSWVLYVFDSTLLKPAMENKKILFRRWVDETGGVNDLSGQEIIKGTAGSSAHMYLKYRTGVYSKALIGVIDPCFDKLNTVQIGVGEGEKNYLIAVSSPLQGSDGAGKPINECGVGSIVLQRAGVSALGNDGTANPAANPPTTGKPKSYTTTEQYISVYPSSDDQYTINVTGTGINPLLSKTAKAKSSTFNARTGILRIPKFRVADKLYEANLTVQNQPASTAPSKDAVKFALADIKELGSEEIADGFQSTYNSANQQILIPRVTNSATGEAYSVILQYHPEVDGKAAWLEVVDLTLIQ